MNIRNLIKEELGISNFAEELFERLRDDAINIEFEDEKIRNRIHVSEIEFEAQNNWFDLTLYVIFSDKSPPQLTDYPIINARFESSLKRRELGIILYLNEKYRWGNTSHDLFDDDIIKSVIMHEMHHFIRDLNMGFYGLKVKPDEKKEMGLLNYIESEDVLDEWGNANKIIHILYYYLSKVELGSVVSEFKYYNRRKLINFFNDIKSMSYNDFSKFVQGAHNGRTPTMKEYNKVQDRLNYFFKKLRKLGVSE